MPLLWISIAFVAGILAADLFSPLLYIWVGIACLGCLLVVLDIRLLHKKPVWNQFRASLRVSPGILLVFLAFGGCRHLFSQPIVSENTLAYYNNRGTYTITARVSSPPDFRQNAVYMDVTALEIEDLRVSDLLEANRKVTGSARVRFPANADYKIGDVLRFSADPLTPSADERFSYKDYLARQHVSTVIFYPRRVSVVDQDPAPSLIAALEGIRQKARTIIFSTYPQPESALLSGILLGLDQDLPNGLKEAYQKTGTAHIIAISGFNMGVLAFVFTWVFSRFFNRYLAAVFSGLVIVLYTVFVGASPSVVRAALMAVSAFGGHLVGRRQSGLNALGLTAALMCLVNPLLLGDVSFQLSFAATLGLVLFADPLRQWIEKRLVNLAPESTTRKVSDPLSKYLLFTLAAQLLTLPIIAFHFGRVSAISLIANPLILPVQSPLLILGGISAVMGFLNPLLGKVSALFAWPLAAYTNFITERLSRLNFGSLVVNSHIALFILVFVLVFVFLFLFRRFFTRLFKGKFFWVLFFLLVGAISIFSIVLKQPDGYLHINLLRTGEETSLMLNTPSGQVLVFDPGKDVNEISSAVSRHLSPWRFQIDQVWLSSGSAVNYLAELDERIPVSSVILPPVVYLAGAETRPVTLPPDLSPIKLREGERVELSGDVQIRVVAENTDSAAILINHKSVSILIPNGVDYAQIKELEPGVLDGLSILVLRDMDISYIPPRVWQAHDPQVVLWNSPSICPVEGWVTLEQANGVFLVSDGTNLFNEQNP